MVKVCNRTEGVEGTPLIRTPDSLEPFCFWSWPTSLLKCILHAHCVKFCIDVHASDGRLAWACWQLGIVYVGICFNEDHAQALEERLKQLFLDHLADPSQEMKKIYNPRYAALIGHTQQTQKDPDHKDLETPRPRKKARGGRTQQQQQETATGEGAPTKPNEKLADEEKEDGDNQEEEEEGNVLCGEGQSTENIDLWDPLAEDA